MTRRAPKTNTRKRRRAWRTRRPRRQRARRRRRSRGGAPASRGTCAPTTPPAFPGSSPPSGSAPIMNRRIAPAPNRTVAGHTRGRRGHFRGREPRRRSASGASAPRRRRERRVRATPTRKKKSARRPRLAVSSAAVRPESAPRENRRLDVRARAAERARKEAAAAHAAAEKKTRVSDVRVSAESSRTRPTASRASRSSASFEPETVSKPGRRPPRPPAGSSFSFFARKRTPFVRASFAASLAAPGDVGDEKSRGVPERGAQTRALRPRPEPRGAPKGGARAGRRRGAVDRVTRRLAAARRRLGRVGARGDESR